MRLSRFYTQGWREILLVRDEDGAKIRELEKKIITWIRKEKMLPRYLTPEDMGVNGGWTETFSIDGVSNEELIAQLEVHGSELGIDLTKK